MPYSKTAFLKKRTKEPANEYHSGITPCYRSEGRVNLKADLLPSSCSVSQSVLMPILVLGNDTVQVGKLISTQNPARSL